MNQYYDPGLMDKEYVMRGNAAILKCSIPSFVADFVYVVGWVDEEGTEIVASQDFNASTRNVRSLLTIPTPLSMIFTETFFLLKS